MKKTNYKSTNIWFLPVLLSFVILAPNDIFGQEDTKSVELEIKSQLGDRLDTYQTVLKIYQDNNETPFRIIEFPHSNPFLIEGLPTGHTYYIDVIVTGMLIDTIKINEDEYEAISLIPAQGGMTFTVLYDDGQTPIDNAKIVIKSNNGKTWQQDVVEEDGKSKRFWIQSNNLIDDYYIAEITIDQSITYTSPEIIKIFPNVQDNIDIKTSWPEVIEDRITVTVYKDALDKVEFSDGRFTVELYDNKNNKIAESKVSDKGKAFFSNLKVGQYGFKAVKESQESESDEIIFPITNTIITGKETSIAIFGYIPIQEAENTCNCVAFRLDDVQDYYLNTQQIEIMKVFQEKNIPLTIGIIGGFWGEDAKILEFVKNDTNSEKPTFEIGNHSWDNNPLPTFSKNDQIEQIQKTNDILKETLGVTPTTFTAVENKFNYDTIEALKETDFTHFTGHIDEIHTPPYLTKDSDLYYLPANTETAELNDVTWEWEKTNYEATFTEAQDFITRQGFAVVMMHPYEFSISNSEGYTGETDLKQIENLEKLIDKFIENDIKIVAVGDITDNVIYDSEEPINNNIESCDCVYFRFVALQDYWLNNIQIKVIETFVENNLNLTIGLIGNVIGEDIKFTNFLKNIVSKNENIVIANNGWNYESLGEYTKDEQSLFLQQGNEKLEILFDESPSILIPPYDIFDENTISAMKDNELTYLSSNVANDPPPFAINSEIQHYPGSATTSMYDVKERLTLGLNHQETFSQIRNSLEINGFAVITLSPPEFAKVKEHVYQNEVSEEQINELDLLIQKIQSEGLEIRPMVKRTIVEIEKPVTIPIENNNSDCDQVLGPFSNMDGCDFRHMTIQQINLGDSNLVKTNFSGLEIINVNFANSIMSEADLTNITMSGGSFENAKLNKINLSNSKFQEVNLRGADFTEGILKNFEYMNSDAKEASFKNADLTSSVFKGVGLSSTDFSNAKLFEADLSGINLANAILDNVNFENAKLVGTSFLKAKITGATLNGADLTNANLKDADLTGADLTGAILDNITLSNSILVDAQLPGANLQETILKDVNLSGANLKDVNLSGSDLSGADLTGAILDNITLSNSILVDAQLPGANLQNMNLKDVNLSGANLKDVNLSGSDLSGATLNGADLTNVNFERTNLSLVDLSGMGIQNMNLKDVNLSGANLKDVNLSGSDLSGATLNGADLTNVNFERTNFSGADLQNTGIELKDLKDAITDDKTKVSETGFFFFRELIAFFESLFS